MCLRGFRDVRAHRRAVALHPTRGVHGVSPDLRAPEQILALDPQTQLTEAAVAALASPPHAPLEIKRMPLLAPRSVPCICNVPGRLATRHQLDRWKTPDAILLQQKRLSNGCRKHNDRSLSSAPQIFAIALTKNIRTLD